MKILFQPEGGMASQNILELIWVNTQAVLNYHFEADTWELRNDDDNNSSNNDDDDDKLGGHDCVHRLPQLAGTLLSAYNTHGLLLPENNLYVNDVGDNLYNGNFVDDKVQNILLVKLTWVWNHT